MDVPSYSRVTLPTSCSTAGTSASACVRADASARRPSSLHLFARCAGATAGAGTMLGTQWLACCNCTKQRACAEQAAVRSSGGLE